MTGRAAFTDEEWGLLVRSGSMVGHAVLISTRALPRKEFKKGRVLGKAYRDSGQAFPGNELIREVVPEAERESKREQGARSLRGRREEYFAETLDVCRKVSGLLAEKASATEAAEFKRWLLSIGEMVASSVADAEFMGIGGGRYSREERETLREVAEALGTVGYIAPGGSETR